MFGINNVGQIKSRFPVAQIRILAFLILYSLLSTLYCFSQDVKFPNVAGNFYPDDQAELVRMVDGFLDKAAPESREEEIFALISPHAGYGFSGQTAGYGYKLVKDKPYKTVIVISPSHYFSFAKVSVYPKGTFRTPLGDLEIDEEFAQKLLGKSEDVIFEPKAFQKEHALEVQLPFLQRVLTGFKIVPVVMGDTTFSTCQNLANLLKEAIANRKDVLVIASTDLYHGYDYDEAQVVDNLTRTSLKNMDAEGFYYGIREGKFQLCGGFPVVTVLILAKELGYQKLEILNHTNSAEVTGKKEKGIWTVGYASCVISSPLSSYSDPRGQNEAPPRHRPEGNGFVSSNESHRRGGFLERNTEPRLKAGRMYNEKGGKGMLNKEQRKRLLEIARNSIETYLKTGRKLEVVEQDPVLLKEMGAFVTLHEHGQLRGCIGNLIGREPLYQTVRDMAVEAATQDSRFKPVTLLELKALEIEISALSVMERVDSADKIEMGKHGVLIKKGSKSGVFLPQVAQETGWTKEEFLSNLCSHKAGLLPDAWKDKTTEIYIFQAEVFSEKNY
ncbi:MAG: AmmeMemoRadiSam system protein B [Candidatus Omnitrophota bacterium]|nr:AmmeMemoRadiSam system protein B [Candidatus Omnitrophota bacterium]